MAALSDSFTKFVMKIENVARKNDKSAPTSPSTPSEKSTKRPGSPFIMLEGDEEFQYDMNKPDTINTNERILNTSDPISNGNSFHSIEDGQEDSDKDNEFSEAK